MNKIILISILTGLSGMGYSDASDEWLWTKSAQPLVIKTVVVCTQEGACKTITVQE